MDGKSHRVYFEVEVLEVVVMYYSTCVQIHKHAKCGQEDLGVNQKLDIKEWFIRVKKFIGAVSFKSMGFVHSWKEFLISLEQGELLQYLG